MNDRKLAIQKLEEAEICIGEALRIIALENKESQFDYITSSKLASTVCDLENMLKRVSKIVFQK